jgi:hypothetical protein
MSASKRTVAILYDVWEEDEPEPPAFEVVFVSADKKWVEVEVDAKTGAVLEVETEGEGGDDDVRDPR